MICTRARIVLITAVALMLSACFTPDTPEGVAEAFWESVIEDNASNAVRYSTLEEQRNFDGFGERWQGFTTSWGRLVVDGNEASIETTFDAADQSPSKRRVFVTYLVRNDDQWLVDYDHTAAGIRGGVFGELFLRLNRFSQEFSRQFDQSAAQTSSELELMLEQLEAKQEVLSRRAEDALESYSEALESALKELQRSIERASREKGNSLSDEEKAMLQSTATNLEDSRRHLESDSLLSIAHSSHTLTAVEQYLAQVDNGSLAEFQRQWREIVERFREDMEGLMQEMAGH
ncbi:hypothetical protein [Pseudomaricurvus sp. HS19]|uniref:hypothetical protein n=1 Tax=Pseudomaricurvus sp. HS19 TaxID=2692626 RepID=UPI00136B6B6C|nr:hypothetical protein [Pseudomaricurvus sp. HS19]MYM62372.1 hypothetical protein [Pseudomaricurvus sp. HS19]